MGVMLGPGLAKASILELCLAPCTWADFYCFPRPLAEGWIGHRKGVTQIGAHMGCFRHSCEVE